MWKIFLLLPLWLMLGGCASDELAAAKLQVSELQQKVIALEAEVQNLNESAKGRRAVRLPTGAPMRIVDRTSGSTANNTEQGAYENAAQLYQSGDMVAAIAAFEEFNNKYPDSQYRADSLYGLGQAYYAQRRNSDAIRSLETLVYQTSGEQTNAKHLQLLQRLYQLSGNKAKSAELNDFIQRNSFSQ